MKQFKKSLALFVALVLMIPSTFVVQAADEDDLGELQGEVASKDEVVYATLGHSGDVEEMYIVNMLEVTSPGKIIDHGPYTLLKNLTDLSEIEQSADQIEMIAEEGNFYYQGNLTDANIPWDISIDYLLDGKQVTGEELAGAEGHLEIEIQTKANDSGEIAFYENYMLQISITLDTELARNIKAEAGMQANAGKNQQINFTVLPEEEAEFSLAADIVDFEMAGISIAGIPSSINIDGPDTDELTDDIETLSEAIEAIHSGVRELKVGTNELSAGTKELQDGSGEFHEGMKEVSGGSATLVKGSADIQAGLNTLNTSLTTIESIDLSELEQAVTGLNALSDGLGEMSGGLTTLLENYNLAYGALDQAMTAIPNVQLTEDEIGALYQSGIAESKVNDILAVYQASQIAKGTYDEIKAAFAAVDPTLETVIASLDQTALEVRGMASEMGSGIDDLDLADGIFSLQAGVNELATNYQLFHEGLVQYANGVDSLAGGSGELNSGIGELATGTSELNAGVGELADGTFELHDATKDLPAEMTKEIDDMIAQYDKSDFEAMSFVSSKNDQVDSVQFVFTTESIENEELEEEIVEEEEKGFWQLFLDLFR